MKIFTRLFLWELIAGFFLPLLKRIGVFVLNLRSKKVIVRFAAFSFVLIFNCLWLSAQTTYDWLNTAPNGNWNQVADGARWNPGGLWDLPPSTSATRLRFNNNTFTIMTNGVPAGYIIGQLFFGSSASTGRTIGGNSVQFSEYSTTWPRIENQSTTLHTINFPFVASSNSGFNMELIASSGPLVFGGAINNNGRTVMIYGNGTAIDAVNRFIRLTGLVSGGGALNVTQFGAVRLNSAQTYTGQTLIDNGELWIESGGGISTSSGIFVGNGSLAGNLVKLWLSNSSGGTTFSNNFTINNGNANTRVIGGLNTSGTNTFSGNITNNSGNFNLSALNAGGTTDFTGVISGSNPVITEGDGTVRFSGANTYTGTTTVAAGTLQLGATNTIPNTAVTLGGGTLSTGATTGFNETAGALTVSNTSTLALGTGGHTVTFLNDGTSWGANNLNVTGWTGTAGVTGTAGKLVFTSLTSNISRIKFTGYGNGGEAMVIAGNEVVPRFPLPPTSSATGISFTNVFAARMTVNWSSNGNGSGRMVVMKASSDPATLPTDGASTAYTANAVFGSGTALATGEFVVFSGSGSSVTVTGLQPGTTYHVRVYEYNTQNSNNSYRTASPLTGNQATSSGFITTLGATNWNTAASWLGGDVPTANSAVTIVHNLSIDAAITNTPVTSVTINTGITADVSTATGALTATGTITTNGTGTLLLSAAGTVTTGSISNNGTINFTAAATLNIGAGGTLTNNGTFTPGTGTVAFAGSGTFAGTSALSLTNFTFINGSAITVSNSVSVAQPFTLASNGSYTFTFNSSTFTCLGLTTVGANTLTLANGGTSAATPFIINGSLSVPTGTSLTMGTSGRALQVNGNVSLTLTGALTLGSNPGGDIYLTGSWSRGSGTFTPNGRAVFFNGTGTQTITSTGGTETFALVFIQNSSSVQLSSTNVIVNGNNGLNLNSSATPNIDLNGRTLTVSGGGNLDLVSGTRSISSATAATFAVTNALAVTNVGTLTFGSNVSVILSNSFNPGLNATTINGTLQLNGGSSIVTNSPNYGSSSTLIYNTPGFAVTLEWRSGVSSGAGVPNHVLLGVDVANSGLTLANTTYTMTGSFTFSSFAGTFSPGSSTVNIGGNWLRSAGTFDQGTSTIIFTGASRTINGASGASFYNLTINNTIAATSNITVSNILAIGSGNIFSLNGNVVIAVTVNTGNNLSTINNGHLSTAATFTFNNSTNYTFGAILTNGAAGVLNVTKSGTGNLTLNGGTYSYTGTTTITAGTLTATAPASLPTNGNISIGNATLALGSGFTGAVAKTLGTLQLTGTTSNLNVGSAGAFDLTFANSSLVGWSGTFNVLNWTPSSSKNIYIIGLGLTTTALTGQLDNFNFDNYGIGSKFDASTPNKVIPKFLYITNCPGPAGGSFSISGSWQNGDNPNLNTGVASIYVRPGDILNQDVSYFLFSANVGGTYNVGAYTVDIKGGVTPTGFITNTGIINMIASSIINMGTTSPINNTGIINMVASSTINMGSTSQITNTGSISMAATSVINMGAGSTFNNSGTVATVVGSAINFHASGGTLANSGSPTYSGAGAINYLGPGTISGTATLGNITITGSVNFGSGSTIGAGASLSINAGGSVNTNPPAYASGSTLVYNTTGTYGRGSEWIAGTNTVGTPGYPNNVTVTNSTTLNLNNSGIYQMAGSLTIASGSSLIMNEPATGTPQNLIVRNNVIISGSLTLGNINGSLRGDLLLGGNFTRGTGGTFNHNQRAVFFNGTSPQTVDGTSSSITFGYFCVDNPTTVQLINSNIDIVGGIGGHPLQLLNGNLDLNGRTVTSNTWTGTLNNVLIDGTGSNLVRQVISSINPGTINFVNGTGSTQFTTIQRKTSNLATLTFAAGVIVGIEGTTNNGGVDFGAGLSTISGTLRINTRGYVNTNPPFYIGSTSLLQYNSGGIYNRSVEWSTSSGAGYPVNVQISNGTNFYPGGTSNTGTVLTNSGNITIDAATSFDCSNAGALNMIVPLSVDGNLTIAGTLTLSTNPAGVLNVGGNWTRTGTFVQNDRNVNFNGSGSGSLTATGGQTFSFMTLNKTGTGRLTINENVAITDSIGLKSGKLTLSSKGISIISTASKTARVGISGMSMGDITYTSGIGKFFVQRYIPPKRSWRLLAAPFNPNPSVGTHSISEAWQERSTGLNYTATQFAASILADTITTTGFATHITGGSTANGFDISPTNSTGIRFYNLGSWLTPGNVNSTSVNSKEGWMLFVRGDRKSYGEITNQIKDATITTLRPRGEIYLGDKRIPTTGNLTGFQVVGNPYASAVDFNTVTKTGSAPNTYTVWDPYLNGSHGTGAFVTLTRTGSVYSRSIPLTGTGTSTYDNLYIPSGAAVMVDFGTTGGSLTFKESDKNALSTTTAFRPVKNSLLQTVLETVENDTSSFVSDGNLVLFGDDFSNEIDRGDARKVGNFSENFGMLRDGKILSIERKNFLTGNDTIFYNLQNMRLKNYRLQFNMENIELAQGTAAFFEDLYLRKKDPVNLNEKYSYRFRISNDSGSFAPNRFRLVFKPSVVYNDVQAHISNENNLVEWKVAGEYNLSYYEVERSLDGVNFSALAKTICGADNNLPVNYSWTDVSPSPALYYYRIKSTSKNNVVAYSKSVKLTRVNYKPTIYIFPNPITSNTIQLQMNKMPEGKYGVRLMTTAGQVIMSQTFSHPAGVATHTVKPVMQLAKGVYQLEITDSHKKSNLLSVVVQ